MEITISKTVQVRQFEPVTVTVTDSVTEGEDAKALYARLSKLCTIMVRKEFEKYDTMFSTGPEANNAEASSGIPKLKKKKQVKVIG